MDLIFVYYYENLQNTQGTRMQFVYHALQFKLIWVMVWYTVLYK